MSACCKQFILLLSFVLSDQKRFGVDLCKHYNTINSNSKIKQNLNFFLFLFKRFVICQVHFNCVNLFQGVYFLTNCKLIKKNMKKKNRIEFVICNQKFQWIKYGAKFKIIMWLPTANVTLLLFNNNRPKCHDMEHGTQYCLLPVYYRAFNIQFPLCFVALWKHYID